MNRNLIVFGIMAIFILGFATGFYSGYETGQDDLKHECEMMFDRGLTDSIINHHYEDDPHPLKIKRSDIYNRSYYSGYLEMQMYYENETNPDYTTVCINVTREI